MVNKNPRGLRVNMPSGYVIGRASKGSGRAELVRVNGLSGGGGGASGGAGSLPTATTAEQLTGTSSTVVSTPDSVAALWEKAADVASAGTTSLGEGGFFHVTGTTTITDIDFATDKAGREAKVKFTGILTLTHNASTLILPNAGSNIITDAGDTACFVSEGSDAVLCVWYQRADGTALSGGGGGSDDQEAFEVPYDNTTSMLAATDVQAAIDELVAGAAPAYSWAWPNGVFPLSDAGSSYATKAVAFTPLEDIVVSKLAAIITTDLGYIYRGTIYEIDSSNVILAIIVDSADVASPGIVTAATVEFDFATQPTLAAGTRYAFAARTTNAGDTYAFPIFGLGTTNFAYGAAPFQIETTSSAHRFLRCPVAVPVVTDTFTSAGNGYWAIGFKWAWA